MGFGSIIETPAKNISQSIRNPFGLFTRTVQRDLRSDDFPDGFTITPIRMGLEVPDSRVRLLGSFRPFVPFEWGGELRTVMEYYPGNREPVVQVLGTQESEMAIRGRFKAKQFPDYEMRDVPAEMTNLLDALRIQGDVCVFRMGEWKRYGYVKKTMFKMVNLADIEYELTLEIVGFTLPVQCQILDVVKRVPFEINKDLIDSALEFNANYSAIPAEMPGDIATFISGQISAVVEAINVVTGFIDDTITTVEDVASTYQKALGAVKYAMVSLLRFKRRLSTVEKSVTITTNDFFTMGKKYELSSYMTDAMIAGNSILLILAQIRARFAELAKTIPLARYRVKDGDSLQRISVTYYRDSSRWKDIYDHNKLTSTELTAGSVLEIPR